MSSFVDPDGVEYDFLPEGFEVVEDFEPVQDESFFEPKSEYQYAPQIQPAVHPVQTSLPPPQTAEEFAAYQQAMAATNEAINNSPGALEHAQRQTVELYGALGTNLGERAAARGVAVPDVWAASRDAADLYQKAVAAGMSHEEAANFGFDHAIPPAPGVSHADKYKRIADKHIVTSKSSANPGWPSGRTFRDR